VTRYVGVDVGKKNCSVAVMDQQGLILEEYTFPNNHQGIATMASKLSIDDRVVMESIGSVGANLYNHLENNHIQVTLANPLKTKAIAWAKTKTDQIDARMLAHLLRANLVAESYVPPKELREVRALVRHRLSTVKTRTMVKNKIHALIDKNGLKPEYVNTFRKSGREWLRTVQLESSLDRLMLNNHLDHLDSLDHQIQTIDQEILSRATRDQYVKLLLSMTGINIYTALLLRSEIGDITRFPDSKKLVSWAGLAPSLHQSGSIEYHGHITKQGSRILRWIMVETARSAVNHDERLRTFYERVSQRRGEQKAIIATANKMLKIIWTILTRNEPYQSRNENLYQEKLNRVPE